MVTIPERDAYNARQTEWALPRLRRVAEMAQRGLRPFEIGAVLGVSSKRACQLLERARELGLLEAKPSPADATRQ